MLFEDLFREADLYGSGSVVVAPIVNGGGLCLVLVLLFSTLFPSSFAIILMRKKELVALL